jgi:uncharacterized protein YjiS (DUF1127 family)
MNTTTVVSPDASAGKQPQRAIGKAIGKLSAFWRRKRDERLLQSLDDHTLKDIGLHRSEIGSLIHNPGGERRRGVQRGALENSGARA